MPNMTKTKNSRAMTFKSIGMHWTSSETMNLKSFREDISRSARSPRSALSDLTLPSPELPELPAAIRSARESTVMRQSKQFQLLLK